MREVRAGMTRSPARTWSRPSDGIHTPIDGTATCTIDQVMDRLAEQPKEIARLTRGLPRTRLHRAPSRGEWSLNDVLAHLRSCSDVWGKYIATIIAEDRPRIRAMSPRTWIKRTSYPELEFAPSLRAFTKQRAELLVLLRRLPTTGWSRSATMVGAGREREQTVFDYAQALADHERSHVKQMARIASGSARRAAC
jgi:DinB superfamily